MFTRVLRLAVGLLLVGALSCTTRADAPPTGPERVIDLEMTALMRFTPELLRLRRGEAVALRLRNTSTIDHEIQMGTGATGGKGYAKELLDGVAITVEGVKDARGSDGHTGHAHGQFMVVIAPGTTATVRFVVPDRPGIYEMGCFIPGHYEGGMRGRVQVE